MCVCVCLLATAASAERRRLSATTASKPSGASLVGEEVFDLLMMYFVVTVEVDANGPYVQVIATQLSHN